MERIRERGKGLGQYKPKLRKAGAALAVIKKQYKQTEHS